ncbi:MAG: putative ATP-grasp-modified RiPP [Pseudonocardiaceae bacterium]
MSVAAEPVLGAFGVFPLGENKDDSAPVIESERAGARPFGLRFAAPPRPTRAGTVVDFSTWRYDEDRQIAVVEEGGRVIEAAKHSDGPTQTPTNTDDGTRYERDNDVTED